MKDRLSRCFRSPKGLAVLFVAVMVLIGTGAFLLGRCSSRGTCGIHGLANCPLHGKAAASCDQCPTHKSGLPVGHPDISNMKESAGSADVALDKGGATCPFLMNQEGEPKASGSGEKSPPVRG